MDSLTGIFLGSFLIGFSGAMMPGPMFVVVVGQSPRRGFMAGPLVVLGHGLLEATLVGAVILGLGKLLSAPPVISTVAVIGGLVLLFMGGDMLRSAGRLSLYGAASDTGTAPARSLHPVLSGILTSLANPYWTIWWATVGLGYLLLAGKLGWAGLTAFLTGHVLSDLVWYTAVSSLVSGGRRWLTDRVYRGLIRACAVGLLFFALYFGWHGLSGIQV